MAEQSSNGFPSELIWAETDLTVKSLTTTTANTQLSDASTDLKIEALEYRDILSRITEERYRLGFTETTDAEVSLHSYATSPGSDYTPTDDKVSNGFINQDVSYKVTFSEGDGAGLRIYPGGGDASFPNWNGLILNFKYHPSGSNFPNPDDRNLYIRMEGGLEEELTPVFKIRNTLSWQPVMFDTSSLDLSGVTQLRIGESGSSDIHNYHFSGYIGDISSF